MTTAWESELAKYLTDVSALQDESLGILTRKTKMLGGADLDGLAALGREEEQLIEKLQECLRRRDAMLVQAAEDGIPANGIRALAAALPRSSQTRLAPRVHQASAQARLLQHQSLVNWVLVQRTLIHLSQLLEIIATGGQMKPTYGSGQPAEATGALVNQVI